MIKIFVVLLFFKFTNLSLIKDSFNFKDYNVEQINVIEEVDKCTRDIFVNFYIESIGSINGFLGEDNQLKDKSVVIECSDTEKVFFKTNGYEIITKNYTVKSIDFDDINSEFLEKMSNKNQEDSTGDNLIDTSITTTPSTTATKTTTPSTTTTTTPSTTTTTTPSTATTTTNPSLTTKSRFGFFSNDESILLGYENDESQFTIKFNSKSVKNFFKNFFNDINDLIYILINLILLAVIIFILRKKIHSFIIEIRRKRKEKEILNKLVKQKKFEDALRSINNKLANENNEINTEINSNIYGISSYASAPADAFVITEKPPPYATDSCSCKGKCATTSCPCRSARRPCTYLCHKQNISCSNLA